MSTQGESEQERRRPPSGTLARAVGGEGFSVAEAVGGPRGVAESVVPGALFVLAFTVTRELSSALWAAVGVAAVLALARLARRDTVQHALAGFVGVAFCAFVARRTGRAEDFYLPGLWINVGYASAYLVSILVRWPLLGLALGFVTGEGLAWRRDPARLRAYSRASWVWFWMFVLRLAVQWPLYSTGAVVALGVARVAMGLPLFAVAAFLSWLILRRVPPARPPEPATEPGADARHQADR